MNLQTLAMWMPGPFEWAAIGVVALLIFGRRLPDVARSVGKSIVEFKRGLKDVKDDIDTQARLEQPPAPTPAQNVQVTNDTPATPQPPKESSPAPK